MMIGKLVHLCLSEFIEGVSQFSVKGDKLSKLRCKYWRYLRPPTFINLFFILPIPSLLQSS